MMELMKSYLECFNQRAVIERRIPMKIEGDFAQESIISTKSRDKLPSNPMISVQGALIEVLCRHGPKVSYKNFQAIEGESLRRNYRCRFFGGKSFEHCVAGVASSRRRGRWWFEWFGSLIVSCCPLLALSTSRLLPEWLFAEGL